MPFFFHSFWCNISGEAAGEIWNWSLLGSESLAKKKQLIKGRLNIYKESPTGHPPTLMIYTLIYIYSIFPNLTLLWSGEADSLQLLFPQYSCEFGRHYREAGMVSVERERERGVGGGGVNLCGWKHGNSQGKRWALRTTRRNITYRIRFVLSLQKASGADITDRHRFVVRANGQSCGQNAQCATYKSVEVSKYIAMHMSSGDIFMTYSQANRGTALLVDCP